MKINNIKNPYNLVLETSHKPTSKTSGESVHSAKPSEGAFSVALSSAVEALKTAAAPEEDQVRRDKVEAIKQQLASGTYNLSGRDVANKILNSLKG